MAGKLCVGASTPQNNAARFKNSKAYCEGIIYRASGTAAEKPSTDNPHASGSEANFAWEDGWLDADDASGGTLDLSGSCCAAVPAIQV